MKGVCKVCELVYKDETEKEVFWCPVCKAYICEQCNGDVWARAEAFGKTTISKIKNWFKD